MRPHPTLRIAYEMPDDTPQEGSPERAEAAPEIESQRGKEVARSLALGLILSEFMEFTIGHNR